MMEWLEKYAKTNQFDSRLVGLSTIKETNIFACVGLNLNPCPLGRHDMWSILKTYQYRVKDRALKH